MGSFGEALQKESPLLVMGTANAYCAIMAKEAGYQAIYLSGAGVANLSFGLPDLGITTLDNVLEEVRRITDAVDLPLLVDIDTGWGGGLALERAMRLLWRAGAAAVHIEDQVEAKRCGHRPGKKLVAKEEMCDRIEAAVQGRPSSKMMVVARSDARAVEGMEKMLERCSAYRQAGAEMLFPEALTSLEEYRACAEAVDLPLLANMTEFGKTPIFTQEAFRQAGVDAVLYPLTAARAMNQAAWKTMLHLRQEGSQEGILDTLQTRDELYHFLDYEKKEHHVERK